MALGAGILCLLFCACAVPVSAEDSTTTNSSSSSSSGSTTTASAQVVIENTTLNPGSFFTGDTGTLTVKVTNKGTSSVRIVKALVSSNEFDYLNSETYTTVGTLDAGASRELTFTLKARATAGMYYPEVQIDMGDSGSIRYAVPIRIDNSEIQVSVVDAADTYMKGQKNPVTVAVFNPRQSAVNGVTVSASGTDLTVSDTAGFIGALAADQSRNVTFKIVPQNSTEMSLTVSYRNGLTEHTTVLSIPVTVGDRSTVADPVVSDIEVASSGGTYTMTGDVTNAGIDDARVVVVTVGSPGTPVDPNKNYVVGSLEADDFASFELTFTATANAKTVPLLIQYKDDDGNSYEKSIDVTISSGGVGGANASAGSSSGGSSSASGLSGMSGPPSGGPGGMGGGIFGMMGGGGGSGASSLPLVPIAGAIIALVVLGVAWKKGLITKARQRLGK
jgi:hypothetical protein